MTRPITPVGHRINNTEGADIESVDRSQDEERRVREDNAYFERTGINRPPLSNDPLVDNNPSPDIANDGDSYDEDSYNNYTAYSGLLVHDEGYVEDNPTQLIDNNRNRNDNRNIRNGLRDDFLAFHCVDTDENRQALLNSVRSEREAFLLREAIKKEQDFKKSMEQCKQKFNNAITGLKIDED